MITAEKVTAANIDRLRAPYEAFSAVAKDQYRWDLDPIDFDSLKAGMLQDLMSGFLILDSGEAEPIGFMLYCFELHKAIEINIIYVREGIDLKTPIDRLMRKFLEDVREVSGWDVISYAMLGAQENIIRTLTWYGFKPMGQAILKFDIMDPITLQIVKQQKLDPLPDGYRLDHWKPEYAGETAQSIYESFSTAADAKWDPRFGTLLGARGIVSALTSGHMGEHIPFCTTVVLKGDLPVGFCFLLQSSMTQGNVPLVGVRPSEKGKGLGNHLLKNTLEACIDSILAGKIGMLDITATMETDNISAIKMYRRMGFREEYNYPHAYLAYDSLRVMEVGKWCSTS